MDATLSDIAHEPQSRVENFSALSIEEILCRVFLFADGKTLTSSARVSRYWFECAIRVLWENVRLRDAMSLLAPVRRRVTDDHESYAFPRRLTPGDWDRFQVYSPHVRRVRCGVRVSLAAAAMALSRPILHIFPMIQTIIWNAVDVHDLFDALLIMSPTVTHFDFSVGDIVEDSQSFDAFCQETQARLPHLTFLAFRTKLPASKFSASLAKLIRGLKDLQRFYIPRFGVTTDILVSLSSLQSLWRIQSMNTMDVPPTEEHISDVEMVDSRGLNEGGFNSLTWLRLSANFHHIRAMVEHPYGPHSLTSITCDALHNETPEQIRLLLTSIAAACPQLLYLALICVPTHETDLESLPCTWGSLRPILQCRSLVQLVIRHTLPMELTMANIEELARDRSTWTCILLAPFPTVDVIYPSLTLSALIPFALHCPQLEELGLFVDGTRQLPEIGDIGGDIQFSSLSQLEFGYSPISEQQIETIALFLAGICARPVQVETTWRGSPVAPDPSTDLEFNRRASSWSRVERLQNEVSKSRWIISLREEIGRLRSQILDMIEKRQDYTEDERKT